MSTRSVSLAFVFAAALAVTVAAQNQSAAGNQAGSQARPAAAPQPKAPAPRPLPMTRYKMIAGDLNGDGIAESIVYDSDSKAIRVIDYSGQAPIQSAGQQLKDVVTNMVAADLDGDGKAELIVGEGLGGYNTKEGPQVDVTVKIYKASEKNPWTPVEVFRKATERPDVTSLEVKDLDGDGKPEILFAYFASKYVSELRIAKQEGAEWKITQLPDIRMGAHVDAGDVLQNGRSMIVVGRPYGDPAKPGETTAVGDAFILDGDKRLPLPVTRGVSSIAVGDLDGNRGVEIVVADGWHSNYGKLARCRIGVLSRQGNDWKYDLIEDLPDHIRFEQIELVDLTGDGKPEIVGLASRSASLGGSVRVYERAGNRWRGMTAAQFAQTFAAGDFDGDKKLELMFEGQPPLPMSLGSEAPKWDTALGEAVLTREVDSKTLVGQPAPALKTTEWIGSDPQTLASLKGKVVMLDFWATWCKPCIEMYPEMRLWAQKYGPEGLVILGITNHSSQTSARVRTFVTKEKLPWAVAIDPKNGTHIDYGVSPIPHTFLIDRQGVIRLSHVGGGDLSKIEAKLMELLAEKPGGSK